MGKMKKMRQISLIAGQNFSGWLRNPRIWITFALGGVLCLMLTDQIITQAQRYKTPVQMFEPFIWTFGDAQSMMLASLLLILLFADMPFTDEITPYYLVRTRRSVWMTGKMVYVIIATCIYTLFLFLVEAVIVSPWAYVGNVWSETAARMGYSTVSRKIVPVSIKTMEISSPYRCALAVFLLLLMYSLFIASLMMFLNLQKGNAGGVVGALAINVYGILLTPEIFQKLFRLNGDLAYRANIMSGWLSPLNQATFSMHNFGYDYLPRIEVSMAGFLGITITLFLLSLRKICTYNFCFAQVDG